jgi:hypothetical protein
MGCCVAGRATSHLIAGLISAAALAWPSWAAEEPPAVPDFAGLWARMTFGLEPPPAGAGPIINRMHRADGASDGGKLVGDYTNPILKPAAAEHVKRQGEISITGVPFPDPSNQCAPQSPPYLLHQQEIQLLQEKDRVTILYMLDHHVRHVRLNATHPARVKPSWMGDSVGHYEGDTLVVDTIGIKVGPLSMADLFGTPQSQAMHVVERYRLLDYEAAKRAADQNEKEYGRVDGPNGNGVFVDFDDKGKGLQLEFTVEDPDVLTAPWSAAVTYRKAGSQWQEQVCAENTYEYYANKETRIPVAARFDF